MIRVPMGPDRRTADADFQPATEQPATEQEIARAGQDAALRERTQALHDDAVVKQAYNDLAGRTRAMLHNGPDALLATAGVAAVGTRQRFVDQIAPVRDELLARIGDRGLAEYAGALLTRRIAEDAARVGAHADAQAVVWQRQQAQGVLDTAARDAADAAGTPLSLDHVATGLRVIETQAVIDKVSPEERRIRQAGFIGATHALAISDRIVADPLGAQAYYERHAGEIGEPARPRIERMLHLPLVERQAAAVVDGHAGAAAATAPSPPELPAAPIAIADRMATIARRNDAGREAPAASAGGDLGSLMGHYGNDPARAFAAYRIGPEALDTALAAHGDGWFAVMPADTRRRVANDVAMLGGTGYIPTRAELPAIRAGIDAQNLPADVRQAAHDEAEIRVVRGERALARQQVDATDAAYAAVDRLGDGFTSLALLDPAVRAALPPETLAALTRQSAYNTNPLPVAESGAEVADLNRLAWHDPAAFLDTDLRLSRDRVTPREYDTLTALQSQLRTDPASPQVVLHRRILDKIARNGPALGADPASADPAVRQRAQALFARIGTDVLGDTGGTRLATDKEIDAAFERATDIVVAAHPHIVEDVRSLTDDQFAAIHAFAQAIGLDAAQENQAIHDFVHRQVGDGPASDATLSRLDHPATGNATSTIKGDEIVVVANRPKSTAPDPGYDLSAFANQPLSESVSAIMSQPVLGQDFTDGRRDYISSDALRKNAIGTFVSNPSTPSVKVRGLREYDALVDRLASGPASGLAATGALLGGYDAATQQRVADIAAVLDEPLMARVGLGARRTADRPSLLGKPIPAIARRDKVAAGRTLLFSSAKETLAGVERAPQPLLDIVGSKRAVSWATPGSEVERYLNYRGAEAASLGPEDILLRLNPSKAAVLEEFLHGTQHRLGIVDRLGTSGIGSAETHVKDFMIRHQDMLRLSKEDVRRIQTLRDQGL